MEAPAHYDEPKMMTKQEAEEVAGKIKEALAAMPTWERELLMDFALSLDKEEPKCLKH